ncbi:hypothetical protein PsorP6_014579 [Peronosclerospora sorghi]|uniref:Uncharacterized protein n=1 Tax=Peronosclerospora sorghi TaxID=230839 RepID=A0ACC0VSV1_9STRA|nr:hypothetical protein PsorP6_014579 [Peronosclerospora sorghi]
MTTHLGEKRLFQVLYNTAEMDPLRPLAKELQSPAPMDTDVEMNKPMEEEHEPVTAVVPSGVPTTTTTQHTPKPPVMSDAMVFRPGHRTIELATGSTHHCR